MTDPRLVVFDAYGTLLDVNAAVARHAVAVGPDAQRLSQGWRGKQLEYTWIASLLGRYEPFWTLTERALDHTMAQLPSVPRALREPLLDAYRRLDAYPEAAEVLQALRARGARTAVLSNGNATMLEAAFGGAGLAALLDRILSVDEVRVFKTAPEVYALVTRTFAVAPSDVTFVSSNRWDVAGAVAAGFRALWVNRAGLPDEYTALPPAAVLRDLRGVLDHVAGHDG
jgi:2-haloacid dehalogenase